MVPTPTNLWAGRNSATADAYEEYLVPAMFRPWAEALVAANPPRAEDHVLDAACGTGIVARLVAPRIGPAGSVTGVDLSGGMLGVARKRSQAEGLGIRWIESDLLAYKPDAPRFSLVFCQQGLQFMPDKKAALTVLRSGMAPGGRLALSVWRSPTVNRHFGDFSDAVTEVLDPELGAKMRIPFSMDDTQALRALAADAGFRDASVQTIRRDMILPDASLFVQGAMKATPIAPDIAKAPQEKQEALAAATLARIRTWAPAGRFRAPMEAHILTARA